MKIIRVTKYRCDFCKRSKWKKSQAISHEQSCIRNPQRICGFCENHSLVQQPLTKIVAVLEEWGMDNNRLLAAANQCPLCVLAAVSHVNRESDLCGDDRLYFDYHKAVAKFEDSATKDNDLAS